MINALTPLHPDEWHATPPTNQNPAPGTKRHAKRVGRDRAFRYDCANERAELACMFAALATGECDGMTDAEWDDLCVQAGASRIGSNTRQRRMVTGEDKRMDTGKKRGGLASVRRFCPKCKLWYWSNQDRCCRRKGCVK